MISAYTEYKYSKLVKEYTEQQTEFHFIEQLGVGSYGVAYLLAHKKTGQKVVLKRLKAKHRKKEKTKRKFLQEIQMLKGLRYTRVPNVLVEGFLKDVPIYIMDYIDGETFERAIFLHGQTFSIDEALEKTRELLTIVITFHAHGIVHRDLRIPNILLKNNELTVIDFGLATYIDPTLTIEGIDNPKKAENHISDLYAVGHFLLYLLYSNYTPGDKKERSWQQELQLPAEVQNYIEKLLMLKTPFASAEEALLELPFRKSHLTLK
ncbi:serine/threonine protein kinase [Lysinibacillus sp. 54212]|uniref:serine/threonine protein kinase n=1 Tax=Lysinibacillus sp. 54212 TaxID=3119829 RepID=UPI002FCBD6CC